jgi:hypothetical protein
VGACPRIAERFDVRVEVAAVNIAWTATFTSDAPVRTHTRDGVLPDDDGRHIRRTRAAA